MNSQMAPTQQVLPPDYDGVFRFSNWTKEEFKDKWGGIEYTFPPERTTPMHILNANPYEVQNIRKKFARKLAEREFQKGKEFQRLNAMNKDVFFQSAVSYPPQMLESYVEKCLKPLEVGELKAEKIEKEEVKPKVAKRVKSRLSGDDEDDSLTAGQAPANI